VSATATIRSTFEWHHRVTVFDLLIRVAMADSDLAEVEARWLDYIAGHLEIPEQLKQERLAWFLPRHGRPPRLPSSRVTGAARRATRPSWAPRGSAATAARRWNAENGEGGRPLDLQRRPARDGDATTEGSR
jgi:hypothetical protein